jgi:hypothetical protein
MHVNITTYTSPREHPVEINRKLKTLKKESYLDHLISEGITLYFEHANTMENEIN